MTQPDPDSPLSLSIHRVLRASPERVFRAWTEPAELRRWFAAATGYTTPIAEVDLRIGGRFRIGMRAPNGNSLAIATGVYQEIVPPSRLVTTWHWEHEDPHTPPTRLILEFRPHPDGTEFVLVHQGFADAAAREQHVGGWQGCLDSLARLINQGGNDMDHHPVVSSHDWLAARMALLSQEKEFTRLRDELNRQRRDLPWEKVEKQYVFTSPGGQQTLAELFENRSQLIVYHFMFDPTWDEGCPHCSFWADNFNGLGVHLNHRDTSFVAVSRAPVSKIEPFKQRMGWSFKWVSSFGSDFNFDYHASFTPQQLQDGTAFYNYSHASPGGEDREGVSVFYRDGGSAIYHTYSAYARGIDMLNAAYHYLDLVPKGRDEDQLEDVQAWVRYHDAYDD